jgi:hypothetical protein
MTYDGPVTGIAPHRAYLESMKARCLVGYLKNTRPSGRTANILIGVFKAMFKKTKAALAAFLILGAASGAMAQRIDPNHQHAAGAGFFTGGPLLTLAAEHHRAFRSAPARLHENRDPEANSGAGCDLLGYGCNYDYYKDSYEACCL